MCKLLLEEDQLQTHIYNPSNSVLFLKPFCFPNHGRTPALPSVIRLNSSDLNDNMETSETSATSCGVHFDFNFWHDVSESQNQPLGVMKYCLLLKKNGMMI